MNKILFVLSCAVLLFFAFIHQNVALADTIKLNEGELISSYAYDGDPDIFIINEYGYKRLFLNPVIFGFYGHLGYAKVRQVEPSLKDEFKTASFYRNCEQSDPRVYALEVNGEDEGEVRHINMRADEVISQDGDFAHKVFCINKKELNWYRKASVITSLEAVKSYIRVLRPSIIVKTPNGGEVWQKGSTQTITWMHVSPLNYPELFAPDKASTVDIFLLNWITPCRFLPCPLDAGAAFWRPSYHLAAGLLDTGSFSWLVAKNLDNREVPDGNYVVQVCQTGITECDTSNAPFTVSSSLATSLIVLSPNGGEEWQRDEQKTIRWQGGSSPVDIALVSWYPPCTAQCPLMYRPDVLYILAQNVSNSGSFSWHVGKDVHGNSIPNGLYVVQITTANGDADISDAPFRIRGQDQNNLSPVIDSISGPSALRVNQTGTWSINAHDPNGDMLTYTVIWDDDVADRAGVMNAESIKQTASFTHVYATPGRYNPTFIITDAKGLSAKTSISVVVTAQ